MSRLPRTLVRTAVLATAGTLLVGLTGIVGGCAAGQITQTSSKQTAIGGINAEVGNIAIRNAYVVAPTGDTWDSGANVPLSALVSNLGAEGDRLVSVSSSLAGSISLATPGTNLVTSQPNGSPSASTSPSGGPTPAGSVSPPPNSSARASASPSSSPSPSSGAANAAAPASFSPLTLRHHTVYILSYPPDTTQPTASATDDVQRPGYLVFIKTSRQLRSGDSVKVTFTFEHAGSITLKLPVAVPPTARPRGAGNPDEEG